MVSIRHVLSTVFRRLLNQRNQQVVKDSNFVGNIYKVNFNNNKKKNNNNSTKLELNKEEEVFLRFEKKRIRMRYIYIHTFPASCHATPVRASTASAPSTPNIAHLP